MNILYRWGLRTHRDNPLHTFITVLDLVFTYSLLYCTNRIVYASFEEHQTDGIGLMWYMSLALNGVLIVSSVMTLFNAFSVTIQERRRRYAKLSTIGATIEQIRRGMFAEAFVMDCAGVVFGMGIGEVILQIVFRFFMRLEQANYPPIMQDHIQPVMTRGVSLSLVLEFLAVLGAVALACRRNLIRLHEPPVSLKPNASYQGTGRWRILGRMFRIGGKLSILLHKHDKKTRASFLPSLVMSIAALVTLSSVFAVLQHADLLSDPDDAAGSFQTGMYFRTLGRNSDLEDAAASFFSNPQKLKQVHHVESYQCYYPSAYCILAPHEVTQQVHSAQASHLPSWLRSGEIRIYRASESDDQLLMPKFVFLKDSDFRSFAESQGIQAQSGEGIWLSCVRDRGYSTPFLRDTWKHRKLTLHFYAADLRCEIGAKAETIVSEGREKEMREQATIVPCRDAQDFLSQVRGMKTQCIRVPIAGVAKKLDSGKAEDRQTLFWDLDRATPTIVLSEQAKPLFGSYLDHASVGSSYTVYVRSMQEDAGVGDQRENTSLFGKTQTEHQEKQAEKFRKKQMDILRNLTADLYATLLQRDTMDGYIAAHVFGEGTTYVAGDGVQIKDVVPNYDVPVKPIYADMHAEMLEWPEHFRKDTLPIFFTVFILLTLFTLFTNIVNVVYANHILYQREYAMLESIGMDEKQNRSLILYEGARYSIYAILYSVLCTLLLYPAFSMAVSRGITYELLRAGADYSASPDVWTGYFFADALDALKRTGFACAECWFIFLLAGIAVFIAFYLTNIVATRRMSSADLVPILKQE